MEISRIGSLYLNFNAEATEVVSANLRTRKPDGSAGAVAVVVPTQPDALLAGVKGTWIRGKNGDASLLFRHVSVKGTVENTADRGLMLTLASVEPGPAVEGGKETAAWAVATFGQPPAVGAAPSAPAPDASDELRF